MEDYDKFVQHCLFQLKKSTEEDLRPPSASSLIRFYGRPILPSLLSRKQKEEMKQHRDKMQKTATHTKFKDDQRMAYVQNILDSVQPRKMSTLKELLQESEIKTASSHHNNSRSRSVSLCQAYGGTKETPSISPVEKFKNGVSPPSVTSTKYSAFSPSNVTHRQSYDEGSLIDQHDNQQGSQPSSFSGANHQFLSSGYATYENVENTTTVSGEIDSETESRGFVSSDEVYNTGAFFIQNTSKTTHILPDIISHPPIDGEELERSGLESSFSINLMGGKDIFSDSFHNNSVTHDHHLSEKHKDNVPFSVIFDLVNGGNIDGNKRSDSLRPGHYLTTELHVQQNPSEADPKDNQVDKEETKPAEEKTQSHPLSLQALLKKSQEYRRRQRMLRNQAKSTKIQERTQGQPRARTEEQSHSDKENDEFPDKGTLTAEGKKTKERRGTFISSVETSLQKSWENEKIIEIEITGKTTNVKTESTHVTEGGNNNELTNSEEKETLKNNNFNSSQEVISKPTQISAFIQQQPLSLETSLVQDAFIGTTCLTSFTKELGKYHPVPTPNFSLSPVPCKSKGSIRVEECVEGIETLEEGFVNFMNKDKVQEVNLVHQNSHTALPFILNLQVEEDVTNVLAKSSQHIDQLESNLSSLKVLISDLESTVKENFDYHCQSDNNMQNETSYKSIKHSEQLQGNQHIQLDENARFEFWEEKQGGDDDDDDDEENEMKCREWPGTHPKVCVNLKNLQPQSCTSDADDALFTDKESRPETIKLKQSELVKTSDMERDRRKEEFIKSCAQCGNCRKQKRPGESVLSVAQQKRIPNAFRNVSYENLAPSVMSVLSETSSHLDEREGEMAIEGHDSIHSPSLNQSYDVDTPSDLWLQEGWGSDLHSQSCLGQDKHLTPESGNEDQEGKSKVKRRLLMHVTEESQEENANTSGGIMPVVRPNSSTPRGQDNQRSKQEQLKQAHAAQVRALQDEHRKQQEELLQALAVRYRLLQNMSFPCSMSSSRLGDTVTFSTLSQQPLSPLSQRYRPLLSAAVKGFLTRRLLKTERVAQLVRTIRDTQEFLQGFQQQSTGREELCSRQDILLQDRVFLQLRAARYEFYDIFFSLSAREQMQLISWDRELTREREHRQQNGHTDHPRGKTSLSAATQKSLERKRGMMIQKKAAERHRGVMRTGQKSEFSVENQKQIKRGQFRAKPERVPKSTCSSRPQ